MTITTTAIGFSLLSLGLAFCGLRFFRAFQKIGGTRSGSKIGILLSSMYLSNATTVGILALGALFFAHDPETLFRFFLVSHFAATLTSILGVYAVLYILFPLVPPWPGVGVVSALGIAVIILTVITHPLPFIDPSGGIDWNTSRALSTLLAYLIFIHIVAPLIIFTHSFLRAKSREVKVVSLILISLSLVGIANISMRFFVLKGATTDALRTSAPDIVFVLMGLVFIAIILLPLVRMKWASKTQNQDEKLS